MAIDRENLFRHVGDTGTEELIQASAFGGLNTVANSLNMPYSDAHRLTNVDVSPGANLIKRKGTRLVGRFEGDTRGINFAKVLSTSGLSFVTAKVGTSIHIYSVANDEMELLTQFENVWAPSNREEHVTVVATNEPEQRFIMLSRSSVPVHVRVVERTVRMDAPAASVQVTDKRFENGTPGTDFFAYVGFEPQDASDLSSDGTTATLTADVQEGDIVTFVYFFWQWWAEAELYTTDRFAQAVTRFNVDDSDRAVGIDERLQDGAELDTEGLYRIYAAANNPRSSWYFIRFRRPYNQAVYAPTDGSLNLVIPEYNAAENAMMGTRSILFGDVWRDWEGETTDPFLVHLIRIRRLTHNNSKGIEPDNLFVQYTDFTSTKQVEQVLGDEVDYTKEYGLLLFDENNWRDPDANDAELFPEGQFGCVGCDTSAADESGRLRFPLPVDGNFTGVVSHVAFGNAANRGLPQNAIIRLVNTETRWVGSAGLSTNTPYTSGTWFPAYGLGKFANYAQGTFPATGTVYQGRLVLGGFPSTPMTLLVSSVRDVSWPGELYNDFTIDAFSRSPDNAFDIDLPGSTSERIQSIGVYQGSVFAAGTSSLHRVFFRTTFDQSNFITQFVGSVGALNERCLVTTVDAGFLLSSTGVYSIIPTDGLDDAYTVMETSFKISNLFDIDNVRNMRKLASLGYDPTTKKLYASIARDNTSDLTNLLVLFTELSAWTRYDFLTGTRIIDMASYRDNDGTERFLLVQSSCVAQEALFLRTEYEYPIDFAAASPGGEEVSVCPRPSQTIETIPGVVRYPHNVYTTGFNDIEDLEVRLDGRLLVFQSEWVKQLTNTVTLLFSPQEGENLTITFRNPSENYENQHELVRMNLESVSRESGNYTIDDTTGAVTLSGDSTDRFIYGQAIATEYRSPVYSYGVLKQYKRFRNWSGLFDQNAFDDVFDTGTPGLTPKEISSIAMGRTTISQNVNLSIIYNNERDGSTDQDTFRLRQLLFDINQFDQFDGPLSGSKYANVGIPIQGVAYSIQACLWSVDNTSWALAGYQLEGTRRAKRYRTGE